ncbi:MAG: M15 family metallopeptidase [Bacilli bacterium]|nr:M15 family metallopeptidase [Bacilli bacterium]
MKKILLIIFFTLLCGCSNTKTTMNELNKNYYCNVLISKENKDNIEKLSKEKYFICNNLDKYLNMMLLNDTSTFDVIRLVNSGTYRNYYEKMIKTDVSKDYLMLINKYYYLTSDYEPNDLETISSKYNMGRNNKLRHEARIKFESMCEKASEDGYIIYNSSAYRSYSSQEKIYNSYVSVDGSFLADTYSARPGNSEHQSGLTVDVNIINDSFANTLEYDWLTENAYKYGFILRYPKDSEKLTGYTYEPWHYRYVGEKAAKTIREEDITFDEYYAYYVENN